MLTANIACVSEEGKKETKYKFALKTVFFNQNHQKASV